MTSVNPINLPTTLQIDSKGNCHDYEQIELKQMNVHIPVNEDVEKESRIYSIKFYSMKQKIDASIGFNHNDKTVVIKSNDLEICKISFLDILGAKELAELNKTLIDTHLIELAFFPKILSKGCCFFCNCKKGSKCCDTKTERNLKVSSLLFN